MEICHSCALYYNTIMCGVYDFAAHDETDIYERFDVVNKPGFPDGVGFTYSPSLMTIIIGFAGLYHIWKDRKTSNAIREPCLARPLTPPLPSRLGWLAPTQVRNAGDRLVDRPVLG